MTNTLSATPRRIDLRAYALPLLLLAAWWLSTSLGWVNTRLIVPPAQVLRVATTSLADPVFWQGVLLSLGRDMAGFTLGAATGISLGCLLGVSRWAEHIVGPSFHTVRQISLFAWLPLLSAWLGYGEWSKLVFIGLSTLYPVTLGTLEGVRSVTRAQADVARVYGFNRWQMLTRLILPAASPQIATGLTMGLIAAWVATIGSEFLLANWSNGLGNIIIKGRSAFNIELIIVGMLAIGLVGSALNYFAARLEARALHWQRRL